MQLLGTTLLGVTVAISAGAAGQSPPDPAATGAHRAAIERLGFLLGEWEGEATMMVGQGERHTVRQREWVESKLDGTVLVIEGLGQDHTRGQDPVTVHHAFAVVTYDRAADRYRVQAHLNTGRSVDADAHFDGDAFIWGFATPQGGEVRYTIRLTEDGEWHETGQMTPDGATWYPFIEMRLQRVAK